MLLKDDHYNFNDTENNFKSAVDEHVSWGYFEGCSNESAPGQVGGDYQTGFQCPPVSWAIDTNRKGAFFQKVKEYASGSCDAAESGSDDDWLSLDSFWGGIGIGIAFGILLTVLIGYVAMRFCCKGMRGSDENSVLLAKYNS